MYMDTTTTRHSPFLPPYCTLHDLPTKWTTRSVTCLEPLLTKRRVSSCLLKKRTEEGAHLVQTSSMELVLARLASFRRQRTINGRYCRVTDGTTLYSFEVKRHVSLEEQECIGNRSGLGEGEGSAIGSECLEGDQTHLS